MGRVSAGLIGVMSLAEKNRLLRSPIQTRASNASGKQMDHDFVIDACWRNKLKDRPN
jgi:hypothetical protein